MTVKPEFGDSSPPSSKRAEMSKHLRKGLGVVLPGGPAVTVAGRKGIGGPRAMSFGSLNDDS